MSATYLKPEVTLDESGTMHAEFDIRNESSETWRGAEGFAVGYHLFDADNGNLIVDGERVPPEHEVKPGGSTHVRLDFALPLGAGRYEIFFSPMREGVAWYYECGWPFLRTEVLVGQTSRADLEVCPTKTTTMAALRRERAIRAVGRAFIYPVRTIWRNCGLIRVMVRRDILGRYRGSFAGAFWTIINPLLLMATYFYVFGVVLQSRFGADNSRSGFALYFLAGMLPWLAFSEAAGRAPSVMLEHRNFVKKLVFAVETLPVNLVVSGLVTECLAIILYCGFLLALRHTVPLTALWLPLLLVPQVLFTAGLSWFLAALGVFVRDLGQIMGFVLTIWFFVTPICYPEAAARAWLYSKNPIYVLVKGYRAIFLDHSAPAFGPLWKLWLLSCVIFIVGHAWFYKLRKSFPDLL